MSAVGVAFDPGCCDRVPTSSHDCFLNSLPQIAIVSQGPRSPPGRFPVFDFMQLRLHAHRIGANVEADVRAKSGENSRYLSPRNASQQSQDVPCQCCALALEESRVVSKVGVRRRGGEVGRYNWILVLFPPRR